MVNHECLPNAARFDYFDRGMQEAAVDTGAVTSCHHHHTWLPCMGDMRNTCITGVTTTASTTPASPFPASTHMQLRMLHALPAGEEVVTSYFPLEWDWESRQSQCREQYGFACTCPRCQARRCWRFRFKR